MICSTLLYASSGRGAYSTWPGICGANKYQETKESDSSKEYNGFVTAYSGAGCLIIEVSRSLF